jgi:hypothetical protein
MGRPTINLQKKNHFYPLQLYVWTIYHMIHYKISAQQMIHLAKGRHQKVIITSKFIGEKKIVILEDGEDV